MKTGSKYSLSAYLLAALASMVMMISSSCDNVIYDDEGECVVHYRVRFKYDYNMKFADAFAPEVSQVTLYAIDGAGNIAWQKTESGAALAREDYVMDVDIAPGTYSLLAWCSSENPSTFITGNDGTLRSLKTDFISENRADGSQHIAKKLDRLYHGYEADVVFPAADEGTFSYTLNLVKDTNHFVITLQQLSGEPIDKNLIEFEITDDNAHLDWDNSPVTGRPVTYHSWYKESVSADISSEPAEARTDNGTFSGVVAEFTTSRLMAANSATARLRVYRTDTGADIVSIRLIDAVLLVKGFDNGRLTDQEYLDRKDEYDMTFFLDEDNRWLSGVIMIGPWRVVYQEHELS